MFAALPVRNTPRLKLKTAAPASKSQRGQWEKDLLGLYLSDHPLSEYRDFLRETAKTILESRDAGRAAIKIGGLVTNVKRISTRTNENMAFAKLEDPTGTIEVVVFPSIYRQTAEFWVEGRVLMVQGKASARDGEHKILADAVWDLPQLKAAAPKRERFVLRVPLETTTPAMFTELKSLLAASSGTVPVELIATKGQKEKQVPTGQRVTVTDELRASLRELLGDCIVEV